MLRLIGAEESFSGTLEQHGCLPTRGPQRRWSGFSTASVSTEDVFLFLLQSLLFLHHPLRLLAHPLASYLQTIKQREPPRSDAILNGFGD